MKTTLYQDFRADWRERGSALRDILIYTVRYCIKKRRKFHHPASTILDICVDAIELYGSLLEIKSIGFAFEKENKRFAISFSKKVDLSIDDLPEGYKTKNYYRTKIRFYFLSFDFEFLNIKYIHVYDYDFLQIG